MFGSTKTAKQVIRETKRIVNRSIREIDRELNRNKRDKKKMESEIKRLSKQGQTDAIRHLCTDVVRTNRTQQQMVKLKALLRQLSHQFDSVQSIHHATIQKTLKEIRKSYQSLSTVLKLPELQAMLIKYIIESERMEMRCEMIDDAMDDALDADSDEADELYSRVMDEIGLDLGDASAPRCMMVQAEEECDAGLEQRLVALSGAACSYTSSAFSRSYSSAPSSKVNPYDTIGLSVGGAKDVNNFRECIEKNRMPSSNSITYNGLLYEYYFDTKTRKHELKSMDDEKKQASDKVDDGSNLFYPSYCYAKTRRLEFMVPSDKGKSSDDAYEYYMTVGLNSNIKTNEFKRKHLNLVIVLDKSGSMYTRWDGKSKMQVANESVVALLSHLTPKDRFALIAFNTKADVMHSLQFINDLDLDSLKASILSIRDGGGTNFECGYRAAVQLYQSLFNDEEYKLNAVNYDYDHRIIFLTDARPNTGRTDKNSLFGMVQKYAENEASNEVKSQSGYDEDEYIRNRIYTTFIGIGVDFNANLIESISKTRGCNYYSVKSTKDFMDKMDDEFEYMVTPLVFNVSLKINCEGNSCKIEKVYGSNQAKAKEILCSGEISRIDTLFPAKRRAPRKGGGTKGGIQLIKFAKLKAEQEEEDNESINVELVVTFEDRNGTKYKNEQMVSFKSPPLTKKDMIESDDEDNADGGGVGDENDNFYDNTGIRKGILLCKYVELIKDWICNTRSGTLKVNAAYKDVFAKCMRHFEREMVKCKDNDLKKEIDLMHKLVNCDGNTNIQTINNNNNNNSDNDEDELSAMQRRLQMLQ